MTEKAQQYLKLNAVNEVVQEYRKTHTEQLLLSDFVNWLNSKRDTLGKELMDFYNLKIKSCEKYSPI